MAHRQRVLLPSVLPPGFIPAPDGGVLETETGRMHASPQSAWDAHMDGGGKAGGALPPGFVSVPSRSRPGEESYFDKISGDRYASRELARRAHFRKADGGGGGGGGVGGSEDARSQPDITSPPDITHAIPVISCERSATERRIRLQANSAKPIPRKSLTCPSLAQDIFRDPLFPPCMESIGETIETDPRSRLRLPGGVQMNQIRWKRAPELIGASAPLFGDISPTSLVQGSAGDCWLMAALSCLAEFPQAIRDIFSQDEVSPDGKYKIRLFDVTACQWEEVEIDDYIPCYEAGNGWLGKMVPLFTRPTGGELWPLLAEKAMAKFVGNYATLCGGHEAYAFMALTGFPLVYQFKRMLSQKSTWERGWSQWDNKSPPMCGYRPGAVGGLTGDALALKLQEYDKRNYLMGASIATFNPPLDEAGFYRSDGLVYGHAYGIIKVVKVGEIMLVQLRNPHGPTQRSDRPSEWNGAWSDYSKEWQENPEICNLLRHSPANDGLFWMPLADFLNIFDKITVLCKSMQETPRTVQRASQHNQNLIAKADLGRECLGLALGRMITDSGILHVKRMTVEPYDPYLNMPLWIKQDKILRKQWIQDKGDYI